MKITNVSTYFVRPRWGFVEIETDAGISGWGEAVLEGHASAVLACVNEMRDYLIGHDPSEIEGIWETLYRAGFYRGGGVLMSAISGIDQALWDIKGKAFGAPVYELMGGKCRNKMKVYSWIGGERPGDVGQAALEKKNAGFKAIKMNATEELQMIDSYDKIFADYVDPKYNLDALEGKVFGIGAESCTVGSHEFYMGYAISRNKLCCLDAGHFHPTEVISDKISSCLLFMDEILLHVSRGVRWDSDHVVCWDQELQAIASEIVRHNFDKRVHIGLDYFDASINRIAAWAIGARNMYKALLFALLEPAEMIKAAENSGDFARRLGLMEELKSMPFAAVWNEYCDRADVPQGMAFLQEVKDYELNVTSKRN